MSDNINRRKVLQYSTVTITSLPFLSENTLALQSESINSKQENVHSIPYDLELVNNGETEEEIKVIAAPVSSDKPAYSASYSLPGLNSPSLEENDEASRKMNLSIPDDGFYVFQFELSNGETDRTKITVNPDGIRDSEAITVHISPSRMIEANTIVE
jgi:hypothetical protein